MTTIYAEDLDHLQVEGWEIGTYHDGGYFLRHETDHPAWVHVKTCLAGYMSLVNDQGEGYISPSGATNTITEALLDLLLVGR